MDFQKLLDLQYLFERRPDPNSDVIFAVALIFSLALLASGLIWLFLVRKERELPVIKNLRDRTVNFLFTMGFVGLLFVFFRFQGIPYFGSRIWLIAWLIVSIVWGTKVLAYLLKKFPKERKLHEEQLLKERYLPKRRRTT